jgi:UDP-N-acetylglucosamine diphosphorylase / glucose-1-phosphate thymidylyltransferase / UDP-N-acetylgalactosamine diphosphorylase / glucosamine-1-phosphate N-acetyltransferase / galactosamine-1-phosphate N-acetyltransferase
MTRIVFTEEFCQPENLFPFTLTRQIQDIRIGILTIRQKWEQLMGLESFDKFEEDYKDLDRSLVLDANIGDDILYLIHGNLLPTEKLVKKVQKLQPGECLTINGREGCIYCISRSEVLDANKIKVNKAVAFKGEIKELRYPWQIFGFNGEVIREDFNWITAGRKTKKISDSNTVLGNDLFVEEGATIEACILNTNEGPIYIGKGAVVMEGCLLRGPLSIGEGAVVKMGAKIYGGTTIGPGCTVGGEIKNSVLFGYSNKAHDGYLGDSVVGEWCNMGAGTSNSNLKNNVSDVVVWTPHGPQNAGMKCGVLMGDYSRTAINTAINTGTVIGVCCNVMNEGLTPKYIPSFSWGSDGVERYRLQKAFQDIANWKRLKGFELTENEQIILAHVFEHY